MSEFEIGGVPPYLKYAGSKRAVVPTLRPHLCGVVGARRLVEPFAGSAAVSLALAEHFDQLWLNDVNPDLMSLHQRVAAVAGPLVEELGTLFVPTKNHEQTYYELRSEFNANRGTLRAAALFVYLNRHCFNGLCRFNKKGQFNVPFGKYDTPPKAPVEQIREASSVLGRARLTAVDFRQVLAQCGEGDVVYCDPPFVELSETSSFTGYAGATFGPSDQRDLVDAAKAAVGRGATVVISNNDTTAAAALYVDAELHSVSVRRSISSKAATRGKVNELIAVFRPPGKDAPMATELAVTG